MKQFLQSLLYAFQLVLAGWRISRSEGGCEFYRFTWAAPGIEKPRSIFDLDVVRYEYGSGDKRQIRNFVVCVGDDAKTQRQKVIDGLHVQLVHHHTDHAPQIFQIGPILHGSTGWEVDFGAFFAVWRYQAGPDELRLAIRRNPDAIRRFWRKIRRQANP